MTVLSPAGVDAEEMCEAMQIDWKALRSKSGPFPPEAFAFVQEGLRHTVETCRRNEPELAAEEGRHVSGAELCMGLRDYALKQYGMLARTVLESWGIKRTEDFGRIVFGMVEAGLMRKTEEDSIEDFRAVYDFDEAFDGVEVG